VKKTIKYSIIAATITFVGLLHLQTAKAMDGMEKPIMEKSMAEQNTMMEKKDSMMMKAADNQIAFSAEAFKSAQAAGNLFLVAFHKKGCPLCAKQQQALNTIYKDPAFADTKVLVVSYDNDTESLKRFNVGMQGTLILYKGEKEISRSTGLTTAAEIEKQIR
jgi:hypothetical protein